VDEPFNTGYYSTAAQVIPVFFLAAVADRFLGGRDERRPEGHLFLLSIVLVAIWGEAIALTALENRDTPATIEHAVVVLAVVLPAGLIGAELVRGPLATLVRSARPAAVGVASFLLGLVCVSVGVAELAGADLGRIVAYPLLVLFLVPVFLGFARGSRSGSDADGD
jgi:hypothetical protein